jgi:hypothetical protein
VSFRDCSTKMGMDEPPINPKNGSFWHRPPGRFGASGAI